jgi:hypothetical protein
MRITKFTTAPRTRKHGESSFYCDSISKRTKLESLRTGWLAGLISFLMIHSLFPEQGYDLSDRGT